MNRREFLRSAGAVIVGPHVLSAEDARLQTEIHVSVSGDDRNSGSLSAPVRTLSQGLQLSRERKHHTGFPSIILLHEGVYELPETIRLSNEDAGTAAFPLRIEAFGGSEVVLSGGSRLQLEWKSYRNGIYQASVPPGTKTDQIFVNGQRQVMARYPNFDENAHYLDGTAADAISPDRCQRWKRPKGAFVHAMQQSLWGSLHYRVTGRGQDGELALEGGWQVDRDQPMHPQLRFVEGVFEELDSPGEWFLDEEASTLYWYPPEHEDLKSATVEIVRLINLIEIGAEDAETVRGISLRGLIFRHTQRTFMQTREQLLRSDWRIFRGGALLIENAEDVICQNCFFDQVGGNAVFVGGHARRVGVRTCRIERAGASGVCFVGRPSAVRNPLLGYFQTLSLGDIDRTPGPKGDEYPRDCFVDDCLIARIGRFEKQSAGVEISMSAEISVTQCSIYGVPRAGINICDGAWGGHVIDRCDVFDTVLETSDHGAFNSWGRDRWWHLREAHEDTMLSPSLRDLPTLDAILPNVLSRTRWACAHGWDIDLDDGSSNYRITENLCLCGGIKFREGYFRTAEDNVLVGNSFHPHVWPAQSGDVIQRNIMYAPYQPIRPRGWGDVIDRNFLHRPGVAAASALELQKLSGKDDASLEGDARFIDPECGDFSLADDSPTRRLGIKSLPLKEYGVRSPSLRRLAKTPDIARWMATPSATITVTRSRAQVVWMGATVRNLVGVGELSEKGAPTETGVVVENVPAGSAAGRGGLRPGDLLLEFNGKPVNGTDQLRALTNSCKPNGSLNLKGLRNQQKLQLTLTCP